MIWATLRRLLAPIAAWLPLVAIIVGGLALAGAVVTVERWRADSRALRATQTALERRTAELDQCTDAAAVVAQAAREARAAAIQQREADRATARRVEDALQTRLAVATRDGRDLARRLHDYETRRCAGGVSAAADAPGEPAGAAGEPAGEGRVGEAAAALSAACARDSERLAGWQQWWRAVSAGTR